MTALELIDQKIEEWESVDDGYTVLQDYINTFIENLDEIRALIVADSINIHERCTDEHSKANYNSVDCTTSEEINYVYVEESA